MKFLRPTFVAIILTLLVSGANADYEAGVNAAFNGDFDTAFLEFSAAAEAGLDVAQYNLAILYFTGQGVDQDFELAFKWTEAAALQGHVNAQFNLGSLYFDGNGVKQSNILGMEWFKSSGRAGHAGSAFALAEMYREGERVSKDLVEAHAWAAKAVASAHENGLVLQKEIEEDLSPSQLSEAKRLFARWQIESFSSIPPSQQ